MHELTIPTSKKDEIIDITEQINDIVLKQKSVEGVVHVFVTHTTAALTTADLDPGTDLDMLEAFRAMVPKLSYRHPHDPAHVPDHILSSMIGTSMSLPYTIKGLILGTWQRIVLIEFDGPRDRKIIVSFVAAK